MLLINVFMPLMAAWCPSQISAQQNALYEIPGLLTVNSLIREYSPGKDVVFNQDGRSCFLLVERQSGVVTEAEVNGLSHVADMEIEGDTLYFCGTYGTDQVIGYFDINDLFTGTNQVNIVTIPYMPIVGGYIGALTVRKLEVLTYAANDVHVFVLGDLVFGAPPSVAPDYTCIVDAMFDGVTWTEEVIYERSGIYFMDDLAVTKNYLMVIGDKHGGTGDYWTCWSLPSIGNSPLSFTNLPLTNISIYSTPDIDYYPISRPLIELRDEDTCVVASYGQFEGKYGVVLSLYNNPFTLADRWLVPDVAGAREFRDLKYNGCRRTISLVPDYFNTLCKDILYMFDLQNIQVQAFQTNFPGVYSVDALQGNPGAVASGMTKNGMVGIWRVDTAECECSRYMDLIVQQNIHQIGICYADFVSDNPKTAQYVEVATVQTLNLDKFCGDEVFKKQSE